jgi:hypothetical protein
LRDHELAVQRIELDRREDAVDLTAKVKAFEGQSRARSLGFGFRLEPDGLHFPAKDGHPEFERKAAAVSRGRLGCLESLGSGSVASIRLIASALSVGDGKNVAGSRCDGGG